MLNSVENEKSFITSGPDLNSEGLIFPGKLTGSHKSVLFKKMMEKTWRCAHFT